MRQCEVLLYFHFLTPPLDRSLLIRTLTQDFQSAVEKPFHDLARRLEARERELTSMASEGVKLTEATADLQAFLAAKKEELDQAAPISAKIDKLRDQVRVAASSHLLFFS